MKPHLLLAWRTNHALMAFTASNLAEFIVTAQQSIDLLEHQERWDQLELVTAAVHQHPTPKHFGTWRTVKACNLPYAAMVQEWVHFNAADLWAGACGVLAQVKAKRVVLHDR